MWNTYFYYLTQSSAFEKDIEIDATVLNESLFFEFLLETTPQITIQVMNNILTFNGQFSTLSLFSLSVSALVALNGVYRYGYYLLWKKVKFEEIPLPLTIRLNEIKRTVRCRSMITRNVSALVQSLATDKRVAPERHVTIVRNIVKNKKMSIVPSVKQSLSSFLVISDQLNQLDRLGVSYDDIQTDKEISESNRDEILKFLQLTNDKWSRLISKTSGMDSVVRRNDIVPNAFMKELSNKFSNIRKASNDSSSNSSDDGSSIDESSSDEEVRDRTNSIARGDFDDIEIGTSSIIDNSLKIVDFDVNIPNSGSGKEIFIIDGSTSVSIDVDSPYYTDKASHCDISQVAVSGSVVNIEHDNSSGVVGTMNEYNYDSSSDDDAAFDTIKEHYDDSSSDNYSSSSAFRATDAIMRQLATDNYIYANNEVFTNKSRATNEFISIITYQPEIWDKDVPVVVSNFDNYTDAVDEKGPSNLNSSTTIRKVSNKGSRQSSTIDVYSDISNSSRRRTVASKLFQWK